MGGSIQQGTQVGIGREGRKLYFVNNLAQSDVGHDKTVEVAQSDIQSLLFMVDGNGAWLAAHRNLSDVIQGSQVDHIDLVAGDGSDEHVLVIASVETVVRRLYGKAFQDSHVCRVDDLDGIPLTKGHGHEFSVGGHRTLIGASRER